MVSFDNYFNMSRREYDICIEVNDRRINKVIIDPHYEEKHSESITDEIILVLVKMLDGKKVIPDEVSAPFSYFAEDGIEFDGKLYKLKIGRAHV